MTSHLSQAYTADSFISLVLYMSADGEMHHVSSSRWCNVNQLQLQLHSNC